MSERYGSALGRSLAFCSEVGDGSLQGFTDRAAWELHHECAQEFSSLAFIVRRRDGSCFVGRPRELAALPVETLLGLLVEENGTQVGCRVRDHALDTVRFIDARFRTSIVVRITFPKILLPDGEAALWFGLQGSATPRRVEEAQALARAVVEWCALYAPVLQSIRLYGERISALRLQLREMTAIAHDAKAPIGALQYLVTDVAAIHPEVRAESKRLEQELQYVEQLLSKFSPSASTQQHSSGVEDKSSICDVVRRVCSRFRPESLERGSEFVLALPADNGPYARISELSLERVLSNVVGNAVRYAGRGEIRIEVLRDSMKRVAIRVSDNGPGMPLDVVDRVHHADTLGDGIAGSTGWGVGLVSCRAKLVASGGDLRITATSEGTVVDIFVPEAVAVTTTRSLAVAEAGYVLREPASAGLPSAVSSALPEAIAWGAAPAGDTTLFIIDDDVEHSASLERLLIKAGLSLRIFSTIEAAVAAMADSMPRWILCDAHMPDGGAEKLLQILAASRNAARCAVMSGETNDDLLYRCAALGAREFFQKPLAVDRVIAWASQGVVAPNQVASGYR